MNNLLTIGGIDSRSGGGISTDLAIFERYGFRGYCAVGSIVNVFDDHAEINEISDAVFTANLNSIADVNFAGIKTGLLLTVNQIIQTSRFINAQKAKNPNLKVVVDPVIVFKEDSAFKNDATEFLETYAENIFPYANLITPNSSEYNLIQQLISPYSVILKNRKGSVLEDVLYEKGKEVHKIKDFAVDGVFAGAGCSHSAISLALLAKGEQLKNILETAHQQVADAIAQGKLDSVS